MLNYDSRRSINLGEIKVASIRYVKALLILVYIIKEILVVNGLY